MLICIRDCYPKYDTDQGDVYRIRANSLFSEYIRSIHPKTEEPSWTIYSEIFPQIMGVIYRFEDFMELREWRNSKIDQILS